MSPLPVEMANHWWQRPGRLPGRELYHWHMLFHGDHKVRDIVATAQQRLDGLAGLDLVPLQWLHVTTYIVAFVDEMSDTQVRALIAEATNLLSTTAPIAVAIGRVLYHPTAVTLALEPADALYPVLDAVRRATHSVGCDGHTDTDPWIPHVSVAYSNAVGPAEPIIAALGRRLPSVDVQMASISLVAQTQVDHTWQWRPIAEIPLGGAVRPVDPGAHDS